MNKRYHNNAKPIYTVTNSEIKQQDGLHKLFNIFADPHTQLIKIDKIYQLFLDNQISVDFEMFCDIIYGNSSR